MQENKVKILIKEPYKEPYIREIDNELDTLQEIVGGYIECVEHPKAKGVDIYVNEEGKLDGLAGNFWLPEYEDCVVGTCFMVGFDRRSGNMKSITDEQIKKCKNYIDYFKIPKGFDLYINFDYLRNYMETQKKLFKKSIQAEM